MADEETLFDLLVEEHRVQLRKWASHLLEPESERTQILNAHLIVEHLLEGIISVWMKKPDVWLEEASFLSKLNLAIALGLFSEHEVACCRVLNSARNAIAHSLEPLPEKWRVELERLAYGKKAKGDVSKDFNKALRIICVDVSSRWLRAKADEKLRELREKHSDRWRKILEQRMEGNFHLIDIEARNEHEARIVAEVDLALIREVKGLKFSE